MVVGRKMQFLTKAQGMPESVQKEIQNAVTRFIWGIERAVICIENMARDVDQGGKKMVDIAKQNMSIDLMWIKQYLNMGPSRPKWVYMMDEIFRMERLKSAKETHQMIEVEPANPGLETEVEVHKYTEEGPECPETGKKVWGGARGARTQ